MGLMARLRRQFLGIDLIDCPASHVLLFRQTAKVSAGIEPSPSDNHGTVRFVPPALASPPKSRLDGPNGCCDRLEGCLRFFANRRSRFKLWYLSAVEWLY